MLQKIGDLEAPQTLFGKVAIDADPPVQCRAVGVMMQRVQLVGAREDLLFMLGQTPGDQVVALCAQRRGYLPDCQLGMILHAPEHAVPEADFRRLDVGHAVGGEQSRAGRQLLHLVPVNGRRVPARRSAG